MIARPRSDEKAKVILEAARTCLGRQGYLSTTIAEIAAEAGVSRGLLHYYFESKEELLAQVVRARNEPVLEAILGVFAHATSLEELVFGLSSVMRAAVEHDPESIHLTSESWSVARQSPIVARELDDLLRRFRETFQEGLADATARGVIAPTIPLDGLAVLLLALADGLGLHLVTSSELAASETTWTSFEMAVNLLLGGEPH